MDKKLRAFLVDTTGLDSDEREILERDLRTIAEIVSIAKNTYRTQNLSFVAFVPLDADEFGKLPFMKDRVWQDITGFDLTKF